MVMYSHSRLSSFEQCKQRFKYAYIDKIKGKNTIEAFMGSRVHETFEKLYNDLKFQKENSLQDLLDYFNTEWDKNWSEDIIIVREEYSIENYKEMGRKFITDYYNRMKPFDQEQIIAIEQRVVIDIGGYQIQGYIDRLGYKDGIYYIHDYKTANSLMTQEYADKDRQLALYAIAIKEMYKDCKGVKLIWHYLAFDKDITSERSEEELEKLKEDIKKIIKEIESTTEFPTNVSALCSWCSYKEICPEFKHQYLTKKLQENEYLEEDGVVLVDTFAKLNEEKKKVEEEYEKVKEAISSYADKEGINCLFSNDFKVSVKKYPRLSFPKKDDPRKDEFFESVKVLGLWDKLAIVDVYELTKLINNKMLHEDLVKLLDKFIERGEVTYVRVSKR